MDNVGTPLALLIMALQDLHDGECAMDERLWTVRDHCTDERMRMIVERDAARSAQQRDRLARIIRSLDEEAGNTENIWLRAILDDADNDADTIERGPLRDIALAGALRKGKQSQRVSYETAIVLAERLGKREAVEALQDLAKGAEETDTALAEALVRLGQNHLQPQLN